MASNILPAISNLVECAQGDGTVPALKIQFKFHSIPISFKLRKLATLLFKTISSKFINTQTIYSRIINLNFSNYFQRILLHALLIDAKRKCEINSSFGSNTFSNLVGNELPSSTINLLKVPSERRIQSSVFSNSLFYK